MSNVASEVLRPLGSGVHGTIFTPIEAPGSMAAVVIGGSGGNEPTYIARLLAHHGVPAMSLAFFSHEGLPAELADIEIAYFQTAIRASCNLGSAASASPLRSWASHAVVRPRCSPLFTVATMSERLS